MATSYEIPLQKDSPRFKFRTELSGVQFVLYVYWNTRTELWNISFYDANENPLVCGIPMVIDTELITRFAIDGMPSGYIVFFDTSETSTEAGIDDIGDRCRLFYITEE